MTGNRFTYEVQIYDGDHWVLDRAFPTEAEALAHGKRLIMDPACAGYRVVRDWKRPAGYRFEAEILSEFRSIAPPVAVTPIEDAPVCTTEQDFYGVEARMAVGRLLRSYCERSVITPTEILHNYDEMRRLLDKDSLIQTAVSRIACLQTGRTEAESGPRRDALMAMVGRMADRAKRAAARADLPDIRDDNFDSAYDQLSRRVPADDLTYTALVVLSRDLVQMRNWLFKLDFLVDLLGTAHGPHRAGPVGVLDGACADVLATPPVLPALLGPRRNLLEGMILTADLSEGVLKTGDLPAEHRLARVNATLASDLLVACRTVLFDLLRRQVKGAQPLASGDGAAEDEAFLRLLERMTGKHGLLGGGAMAEALTIRYGRSHDSGGAGARRQAISEVAGRYSDPGDRLRYLFSLSASDLGRQHARDIVALVQRELGQSADARHFITEGQPLAESLDEVTGLYELAVDSALAAGDKARLADAIDSLLALYIANHQVVHRLDNPGEHLRDRANRLVRLCAPGVLRSPKALGTVRALVIAHLRRSDFDRHYTEGLASADERQRALREFHGLLSDAGFC